MNKTRLLYRMALAASALVLGATATLSLLGTDLAPQIGLLSLGILGGFLASHLRLRMVLAGQRAGRRAAALQPSRAELVGPPNPVSAEQATTEDPGADLETILTGFGDIQAAVAASESFLLAELVTLRQRLLALEERIKISHAAGATLERNTEPDSEGCVPLTTSQKMD